MNIKTSLIFLLFSALLASCGKRSAPEQLEPNGYPHVYPAPTAGTINAQGQ